MRICSTGHILFFRPFHRVISMSLDDRQTDAFYLLVDIQGIYIRHATDIVDDGHDARLELRGVDLVLARNTTDEVLGVETLRMDHSPDELLEKRLHDLVTREFDVEYGLALVDALQGEFAATLIGLGGHGADMVDEATLEGAVEDILLVLDEHTDTLVLEFADDTGAQVDNLLIIVGNPLVDNALTDALLDIFIEETEQQIHGRFK